MNIQKDLLNPNVIKGVSASNTDLFKTALAFLTVLPVKTTVVDEETLGRSMRYFPAVGLIIGLLMVLSVEALNVFGISQLTGIVPVAIAFLVSGGLHVDGLADTADGLMSGGSKSRIQSIMKDSSVGAFGVTAIILVIAAKYRLYESLAVDSETLWTLAMIPALSRWGAVVVSAAYEPIKETGLGRAFIDNVGFKEFIISGIICMIAALLVAPPTAALAALTAAPVLVLLLGMIFIKRAGGLTGDMLGAIIEINEVLMAAVIIVAVRWLA